MEVDISRSSIGRLSIYAAIGIPEAWPFDGDKLEIRQLTADGNYVPASASRYFPTIPIAGVQAVLSRRQEKDSVALLRDFRAWVREQVAPKS